MEQHSRPQPSFEQTKEESYYVETLAIFDGGMAAQHNSPGDLTKLEIGNKIVDDKLAIIRACHTEGRKRLTRRFEGASARI